ncbi:MAG TPA: metalloregulator ArsR/SmtB family transcription factor [Frankiaceae bacterium]|nr:metalloregulator ArsR/SmtB family transcription factor [Frankiaceae bacterium]
MHLIPTDRRHRRVLDEHAVCDALAGLPDDQTVRERAAVFAAMGDPNRLTLLLCMHTVPDISVTDLAVAANMNDSTVSQALRLLRSAGLIGDRRDGRVIRYRVTDTRLDALLRNVSAGR